MIYKPYEYQSYFTERIINDAIVGGLLDMGLGKTVSTLTAIDYLLFDSAEVVKPLIIAPKRVAQSVWSSEIDKWDHLKHLKIAKVLGTEKERKEALNEKADIWIINAENVHWLVAHYATAFPFDMIVVDESSKFKNPDSVKFKALKQIRPKIKRVVILTGTPTPNGLLDIWSQIFLLDRGARLGETFTSYRNKYFKAGRSKGFVVYEYNIMKEAKDSLLGPDIYEKEIHDKISDICISMKKEDYLKLPKRIDQDIIIDMPAEVRSKYNLFEKELFLEIDLENELSAANAAVLSNKLLQFANGAVYKEDKTWQELHTVKLEALREDIEAANGKPVLVFYNFKHDAARMHSYLKDFKPVSFAGQKEIDDWNDGKIPVMFAHPKSAGHGLNIQYGGHIINWFGCPWSLEDYTQSVARLDRNGQTMPVINRRLIIRGTMDEDVLAALERKTHTQNSLMEAVKARIKKYRDG